MTNLFNSDKTVNRTMAEAIFSYNEENRNIVGKFDNVDELIKEIENGFDPMEFLFAKEVDGEIVLSK